MRVTFVTTSFPIHKNSSSGPFVFELAQHLSKYVPIHVITPGDNRKDTHCTYDFEVTCFRYAPQHLQILAHQSGGIPAQLQHNSRLYLLLPTFFLGLLFSCIKLFRETDIFHCNWAITGCVVGICSSIFKIPCVTTIRGSDVHLMQKSVLHKAIMRLCILFNKKIIVVSHSLAQSLRDSFNIKDDKMSIIPNGVSFAFSNIIKSPDTHQPARLLWIGNLTKNKNLEFVIHAFSQLSDKKIIHLTVVGDGPERERLLDLTKHYNLESTVEFVGTCSHNKIPGYFDKSDVFIMSSISEGRSNVLLEALAAGMVIVAPQVDSVVELIKCEKPFILYKQNDLSDFVNKLELALRDTTLRAQLIKLSKSNFKRLNLDWDATAEKYISIYNSCI